MNKIQNPKTLAAVEREREREREGLFYSTWNSFTRLSGVLVNINIKRKCKINGDRTILKVM